MKPTIQSILETDNVEPGGYIQAVCDDISARHPGRIVAFIYYGSSLRDMNDPDKMLDFYVIVDSYRKTHKNPVRALLNRLIPPAVYYHELQHPDGITTTCKYSIMSLRAFERRCSPAALLSQSWGRFSQPCAILFARDMTVYKRLMAAREIAVRHMASQTAPLFNQPVSSTTFWARGFLESYRTELRPESSQTRSEEIVGRYAKRYDALMRILYGAPNEQQLYRLPTRSAGPTKLRWFLRRLIGKPVAAIRILNSALTFSGGYDYIESKIYRHSGIKLDVTQHQRRHPLLWSPVLAWRYWRAGAFR